MVEERLGMAPKPVVEEAQVVQVGEGGKAPESEIEKQLEELEKRVNPGS
jgi:hypothetical protein